MRVYLLFFNLLFLMVSCKIEPKEINLGNDMCHFCKMTIIDKPFASEIVNSKGKAFMYDAIECLVQNLETEELDASMLLVYDYQNTKDFIDATTSYFVISEKIKSPMGKNLAAFKSKNEAIKFINKNTGNLYSWNELKVYLNR